MSYNKSYYETNREKIIETGKKYRKDNLQFVKRNQRIWYIRNKKYILCSCGTKILKHNEKNHIKTLKHNGIIKKKIKPKIKTTEKTIEKPIEKVIPYKTIFVSKGKIKWGF